VALNAQLTLSILAHESSAGDLSRTLRATPVSYALSLGDGTGANQAQVAWSDSRSIGTTPEDLDLRSLSDTRDGAAVAVAFTAIKAVYVRNTHATASLVVGGGSFSGLGSLAIPPGGVYFVTAPSDGGFTVNPAAAVNARFAAASGTVTYDIVFIGEGTVT
jgi:hypothetical protein